MGLCSSLASCLALGVQYWSLLAIGWSWVLVLRQRSLGEHSPIDITLGREVSGGSTSWTRPSHLGRSGPTPSCNTKTLPAAWLRKKGGKEKKNQKRSDQTLRQMVKTNLHRQNHIKKHTYTHSQKEKKEKEKSVYIYIYIFKKTKRKRATKPINKSTNDDKH